MSNEAEKIILTDIGTHIQEWAHRGKACHKVIAEMELESNGQTYTVRIENPKFEVYEKDNDTIVLRFSRLENGE